MKSSKTLRQLFLFLIYFGATGGLFAQSFTSDTLAVYINAAAIGDSIVLRWAPANYATWNRGNEYGYRLERSRVMVNDSSLSVDERRQSLLVLDSLLLPLPEAAWESMADTNDMAGVAASAIHGEGFLVDSISTPGDIATAYNINQEEENRYNFGLFAADQSLEVGRGMGLAYVDNNVVANTHYLYRIRPNGDPDSLPMEAGYVVVSLSDQLDLPAPGGLGYLPADSAAHLHWSTRGLESSYSSYLIECSQDGGQSFVQVNNLPTIYTGLPGQDPEKAYYSDTLADNSTVYVYRVRGRSPFGLLGPPSDTLHVRGRPDPVDAHPAIYEVSEAETGKLLVEWDFPAEKEEAIRGFDLYRSTTIDGLYRKITPSPLGNTLRQYTDASPTTVSYYKVVALDHNDYELSSHPALGQLNDTIPPAAPLHVTGSCDPEGLVSLRWDDNQEADLMGYRVFISNQPDTNFAQITASPVEGNRYFYDIDAYSLSEEVYFKVMAVDYRENRSPLSASCTVQRPDHHPPAPSVFSKVSPGRDGISLQWVASSSRDIAAHQLQRKLGEERHWTTILQFDKNNPLSQYLDTTAWETGEYHYRMLATDDGGLTSISEVVRVQALDNGIRPPIVNLTIELNAAGDILLRWNYPGPAERLMDFQVFRAIGNGPMRNYDAIDVATFLSQQGLPSGGGNYFFYIDEDHDAGNTYHYQLMARYLDGGMSPLSTIVTINL